MSAYSGKRITCLACDGKGYLRKLDSRGLPYPVQCSACGGSGKQMVK